MSETASILAAPLTADEAAVLEALRAAYDRDPDFCFRNFSGIANESDLPRERAAEATRALRLRGLAKFAKGLCDDMGEFFGSGYAITEVGHLIAEARRARADATPAEA
ncbi:hypothetical protein [Xanthobacter flavus]|uniref:hypothetical protein n=1 Tax=Xanthobacter flavus TaxID=281 RepID=UPI00372BF2B0